MANNLHVRIDHDANESRIWTTLPEGTQNSLELDADQSKRLRQRISQLGRRNQGFRTHAARLRAGKTVRSYATGRVAEAILAVVPESSDITKAA